MVDNRGCEHFIRGSLGLPESAIVRVELLFKGGSDRSFYRVRTDDQQSFVFMHYNPERKENNYYAAIAEFLHGIDVSVPRIIRHDPDKCFILMQDLGGTDLWSLRQLPWEQRRTLYRKTLDLVARLHAFPLESFPGGIIQLMEPFEQSLYQWERNYFREHFVERICNVRLSVPSGEALDTELTSLAGRLEQGPRSLVHRDLQSKNIIVVMGESVLIDFQGMRFGNPLYDLGSLLYDPYVQLTDNERMDLLSYYYGISHLAMEWEEFQRTFHEASAQRLMQALGAFGFLGGVRGLHDFMAYIPQGLENLISASTNAGSLLNLPALALHCKKKLRPGFDLAPSCSKDEIYDNRGHES